MWIFLSSLSFSANDQNICTTNWCGSSLCLGDNPKDTSTHVCFWPLCPWNIWNKTQPTPWALFLSVGNNQRTSRKALCGFSLSPGLGNSQNPETRYHGFSVSSALWNLKTCLRTINVFFFSLSLSLSLCVGNDQKFNATGLCGFSLPASGIIKTPDAPSYGFCVSSALGRIKR